MRVSKFDTIAHNRLNPLCHFPFFKLAGWEESSPGDKRILQLVKKINVLCNQEFISKGLITLHNNSTCIGID